jgi:hypothetical protein
MNITQDLAITSLTSTWFALMLAGYKFPQYSLLQGIENPALQFCYFRQSLAVMF